MIRKKVLKHKFFTKTFVEFVEFKEDTHYVAGNKSSASGACAASLRQIKETKIIKAINQDFMADYTRWSLILQLSNMYDYLGD